ncbi:MAG: CBS domain-containing protein [Mariprofundaceae bacterium]|nr:CBS domain-containing protein [Mariprofundaceae bacterium]
MKVSQAMSSEVVSVSMDDSLKEAVCQMVMHNIGMVTVTDADENLIGVVTVRDVMLPLYPDAGEYVHDTLHARDFEAMEENYDRVLKIKVGDVMTANPVTVSSDDSVLKAASFMGLKNLRRIPVVDDGKQMGILSIENINNALFLNR